MKNTYAILSTATVLLSGNLLAETGKETTMDTYTVIEKPAIHMIGIDCRTSNDPEAGPQDIPNLWGRFYGEEIIAKIPNKVSGEVFALYCDYEGDYTQPYTVVIGCAVSSLDDIPDGLVAKTIPKSSYAQYRAVGEYPKELINTWGAIWNDSDLNRTYTGDYELYGENFFTDSPQEVEVYVALEKDLSQSVLQGRLDAFRSGSLLSPHPKAAFAETNDSYHYAWGMDLPTANGIMEKDPSRVLTDEEIDHTISYFTKRNLPFIWWTSSKVLETKGFMFAGVLTGMGLDISKGLPEGPKVSSDLQIKVVKSDAELKIFTELAGTTLGMGPELTEQWLPLNDAVMKEGEQIHYIAYLKGIPVGTATLATSQESAGIWNVATLPEHRNQGVGSALTHAALVEAKKQNYNHIMAILMPKGMAWGVFTKFGFEAAVEFPFYVYGVSPDDLEA